MNQFIRLRGNVVTATLKSVEGEAFVVLGLTNIVNAETGIPVLKQDSFKRPASNIERLIGYSWHGILSQGLINAKVEYDYSFVKKGSEFTLYEGSEEVLVADEDRPIHNMRAIEVDFAKMPTIAAICKPYVAMDNVAAGGFEFAEEGAITE